jgi:tetratricopeptide (TPR) repeat protein
MTRSSQFGPRDTIAGRYLVHDVKAGGMGEVYLCLDLEEGFPLALKTFQRRYFADRKIRELFHHEAATWVALENHPNIVHCIGLEILESQPFLVLEWVASSDPRGVSLRGWLKDGQLGMRQALDFTIDLCRGLAHAGRKQPGLVHRDLKPENILIADRAKITDFGLALAQAKMISSLGFPGDPIWRTGTPAYMAPEQWSGRGLDVRTDLYALGCVFFEMLAGVSPFDGASRAELGRQHMTEMPRDLPTALPEALRRIVMRCLAKDPGDRFPNAEELLAELSSLYRAHFAAEPIPLPTVPEFTAEQHANRAITFHWLGRYEDAVRDCDRALKLNPDLAPAYNYRGLAHYRLHQPEEAISDYTRAIELGPPRVEVYSNRGNAYSALGRHDLALADFSRAIELAPRSAQPLTNRGATYLELGRYAESLADLGAAIDLNPLAWEPYACRADVFCKLERTPEAFADFDRALELNPMAADVYTRRGGLNFTLGRLAEARADLERSIEINPGKPKPYIFLIGVLFTLQEIREAGRFLTMLQEHARPDERREAIRELTATWPPAVTAPEWGGRGLLLSSLGDYEAALECFDRALDLAPESHDACDNKGFTLYKMGRLAEADRWFDRSLHLNPDGVTAWSNKGNVMGRLGRFSEALACFDRALAIDPAYEPARQGRRQALQHLDRQGGTGPTATTVSSATVACARCKMRFAPPMPIGYLKDLGVDEIRVQCPACGAILLVDLQAGAARLE